MRHRFHGTAVVGVIYLFFPTLNFAQANANFLGEKWNVAPSKNGQGILGLPVTSEKLVEIKDKLADFGVDRKKIDSMKFSVDFGEEFSFKAEVEAPDLEGQTFFPFYG